MPTNTKAAQRTVRIIRLSFIVYSALLILVIYRVPSKAAPAPNPAMELIITVIALADVAFGFLAPRFLSKLAARPNAANPRSTPEKQWISRCILSLALFNSCNLFAVVLHFVGARVYVVGSLVAVGTLSMLLWSPGNPPGSEDQAITRY